MALCQLPGSQRARPQLSFHADPLEQAEHLARREPKKPRQASLRRAVSTAYYGLFHMLLTEGAAMLVPNNPAALRLQVRRAVNHQEMKQACQRFASSAPAIAHLLHGSIEPQLIQVAAAFVQLQEERHKADYDLFETFDRVAVLRRIAQVRDAFAAWKAVRHSLNAKVFLAALFFQGRWRS